MAGLKEATQQWRTGSDEVREKDACCPQQRCLVSDSCPFDCIAITAPNPRSSKAYLEELVHRVGGKGSKEVLILAVSDPEGVRIGSGGGTLNAILEVISLVIIVEVPRVLRVPHGGFWLLTCLVYARRSPVIPDWSPPCRSNAISSAIMAEDLRQTRLHSYSKS